MTIGARCRHCPIIFRFMMVFAASLLTTDIEATPGSRAHRQPAPFDPYDRLLEPASLAVDIEVGIPGMGVFPKEAVEDAIPIYESMMEMLASVFPDKLAKARGYHFLAGLYQSLKETQRAEELHLLALNLAEESEPGHLDTAGIANNVGLFYMSLGRQVEAEAAFRKALEILGSLELEERPYAAIAQQNLASVFHALGEFGSAQEWYWKALDNLEAAGTIDREKQAAIRQNLAHVHLSLGDLERAEDAYRRLLDRPRPSEAARAATMNGLAETLRRLDDSAGAETYYRRAAELFAPESEGRALVLGNLGLLYYDTRDLDRAATFSRRALEMRQRLEGPDSLTTAVSRFNLAMAEHASGQLEAARQNLEIALDVWEEKLPTNHPALAMGLENLAILLLEAGESEAALDVARDAQGRRQEALRAVLSFATEAQRLAYLEQADSYSLLANLTEEMSDVHPLAQAVLRTKGVVLDSLLEERQLARLRSGSAGDGHQRVRQLNVLRRRYMRKILSPNSVDSEKGRTELEQLEREIAVAERELASLVGPFGRARRALSTELEEVRNALEPGQVLVEIVRYQRHLGNGILEPYYGALVLASDLGPWWLPLAPVDDIDESVEDLHERLRCGNRRGVSPLIPTSPCGLEDHVLSDRLRYLYQRVWKPIEERISADIRQVIISPDAGLHILPFSVLLDERDGFLVERYRISYVPSGRDLLTRGQPPPETSILVYARPAYGSTSTTATAALRFDDLPFTAREAAALRHVGREHDWRVEVLEGAEARESALRERRSAPGILHLATHGGVLPTSAADGGVLSRIQHPMYRGYVALSGAQGTIAAWERDPAVLGEDDGILTAEEIRGLDLAGTWLAAIATCDSGLGEARVGEGILGLRRGFALAGVQNLLMTLWAVNDRWTAEFMADFYTELFRTRDAASAVSDTQKRWLLRLRRDESLAQAVLQAGSFVLSSAGPSALPEMRSASTALETREPPGDVEPSKFYSKSYALVIGIDKYASPDWPSLSYATSDAAAVARFLENRHFEVRTLYDSEATKQTILSEAYSLARQLNEEDRVLVFFAGHGHTESLGGKEWGYIVPHDGSDGASYLSVDELQSLSRWMDAAKHQLFVMDACYGGMLGLFRSSRLLMPPPEFTDELGRRKARQILTAGGTDQMVLDGGPDGHSYFTGFFLKGLREGEADQDEDGYITSSELAAYLIPAASNRHQTPMWSTFPGHAGGEFIFLSPGTVTDPHAETKKTAKAFLDCLDDRDHRRCYEMLGDDLRRQVPFDRYRSELEKVTAQLPSRPIHRQLVDVQTQAEWSVVRFKSDFDLVSSMTEAVTLRRQADDSGVYRLDIQPLRWSSLTAADTIVDLSLLDLAPLLADAENLETLQRRVVGRLIPQTGWVGLVSGIGPKSGAHTCDFLMREELTGLTIEVVKALGGCRLVAGTRLTVFGRVTGLTYEGMIVEAPRFLVEGK